jgi:hypothetical protein
VQDFAGLKISGDKSVARRTWGVHPIEIRRGNDRLDLGKIGRVGWGGNSGFHVLNLAVQMRPERIVLVGYDMTIERGLHWHGAHEGLNNPREKDVARWRRVIDAAAGTIAAIGIKVYNASEGSALEQYPKVTLEEALRC